MKLVKMERSELGVKLKTEEWSILGTKGVIRCRAGEK